MPPGAEEQRRTVAPSRQPARGLIAEALRSGTVAGLAMIPFAAYFRSQGLRVNEYGRKTLSLLVGDVSGPVHDVLTFVQHLAISWLAAVPLLLVVAHLLDRRARILAGLAYGGLFYVAVNALALPLTFSDPTPWTLGWRFVYPSLVIHLVYGLGVALTARPRAHLGADPVH